MSCKAAAAEESVTDTSESQDAAYAKAQEAQRHTEVRRDMQIEEVCVHVGVRVCMLLCGV